MYFFKGWGGGSRKVYRKTAEFEIDIDVSHKNRW